MLKQSHCNRGEYTAGQHTSFSCFVDYIFFWHCICYVTLFICHAKLNVSVLNSTPPCKKSFNHSDHCLLGWHVHSLDSRYQGFVGSFSPASLFILYPESGSSTFLWNIVPLYHCTLNGEIVGFSEALVPLY